MEAELGLRYEGERSKFQEEANARANEMVEEVRTKRQKKERVYFDFRLELDFGERTCFALLTRFCLL